MRWIWSGIALLAAATLPALMPHHPAATTDHPVALVSLAEPSPTGGTRQEIARRDGDRTSVLTGGLAWAAHPSPAFDGSWFVFAGRERKGSPAAIFRSAMDGSGLRMLTAGEGDPSEPILIPGGSLVFTDRAPGAPEARALYACSLDGSSRRRLTVGPHRDSAPRLLDDGRVAFDRAFLSGARAGESLAFTIHPDGTHLAAALASAGPAPLAPRVPTAERAGTTGLVPASWGPQPGAPRDLPELLVLPRRVPPVLTSVVNETRRTGTLLCLNVRDSRDPAIAALPPGRATKVRAWRVTADGDGRGETLAEARIQPDGSFLIEVPADTLLGLALLDDGGTWLATFDSGVWVRPNENRGCVGCHEASDRAPANRRPMAIMTSAPGRYGEAGGRK